MKVKTVRELAYLLVDNEMDRETLIAFRTRAESCPECAREMRHVRRVVTLVRERCGRQPAPSQLRRRILELLHHQIQH